MYVDNNNGHINNSHSRDCNKLICFSSFWTLKDERKHDGTVDKSSSNNRSMLWIESTFLMLKTGPICLALVGLMAGHQTKMWLFKKFLSRVTWHPMHFWMMNWFSTWVMIGTWLFFQAVMLFFRGLFRKP